MLYQAVFSDIDGTLLNSQHQISPQTEQAIKTIIQRGVPFIPVSARPPYAITPYRDQLQSQQAIICYSGALILDNQLKPLYSVTLGERDFQHLQQLLVGEAQLSINYYLGLDWFSNDPNNIWTQQESQITGLQAKICPAHLSDAHKILVIGEAARIAQLEQKLKQNLPQLSIHRSKNEYLEIMNKQATKSQAIDFMLNLFNLKPNQIIAFGDNYNDLDMLQYAGLSVAMGNAPAPVQAAAKQVTADNDHEGIALVLAQQFHLD